MKGVLREWVSDAGFWSLLDQCTVSAGNFLTAILLARALAPAEYGVYALLLSLLIVANALQSSVVCYALSFYGASVDDAELPQLAGGSLVITSPLALLLGGAAAGFAVAFHHASLSAWIVLALVFWQLQETTRRALMSRLRHREAIWGDTLSYLGQAALVAYLFFGHELTLSLAFQVMAATSGLALAVQAWQLRLAPQSFCGAYRLIPKFWSLGKHMLGAWAVGLANNQLFVWTLALTGVTEVAIFQSFVNVLQTTSPVTTSIQNILIPAVAVNRDKGRTTATRVVRRYATVGAYLVLPFYVIVAGFPRWALSLVYGSRSLYVGYGTDFRVLAAGYTVSYAVAVLGSWAAGLGRSDWLLRSRLAGAALSVTVGLLLVVRGGVFGAALAFSLTLAAQLVALAWLLRRNPDVAPTTVLSQAETSQAQR